MNGGVRIAADFRVRKAGSVFAVWQRVGPAWERLADVYSSRADARAAVTRWLDNP